MVDRAALRRTLLVSRPPYSASKKKMLVSAYVREPKIFKPPKLNPRNFKLPGESFDARKKSWKFYYIYWKTATLSAEMSRKNSLKLQTTGKQISNVLNNREKNPGKSKLPGKNPGMSEKARKNSSMPEIKQSARKQSRILWIMSN